MSEAESLVLEGEMEAHGEPLGPVCANNPQKNPKTVTL